MSKIGKVRKTVMEMFEQRGYTDIDDSNTEYIMALDSSGNQVCAFTEIIPKLNNEMSENIISRMEEMKLPHAIFVYTGTPTPAVKTALARISDLNIYIELFEVLNLQFNCTKHELVPHHTKLSREEAIEFRKQYGVLVDTPDKPVIKLQIPILSKLDPIARFYDFQKGDIIQIKRPTGVIGYRIVK